MLEFEENYCVDIDDILHNQSLFDEYMLQAGYNEPLWFAINRYHSFLIENAESKTAEPVIQEPCLDRFLFNGRHDELIAVLEEIMDKESAEIFSRELVHYKNLLDSDEYVGRNCETIKRGDKRLVYFMLEEWNYNINIKALTLISIALLLDIKLTLGFSSAALTIMGINGRAFVKVSAEEAEKCLIMEALQKKPHIIDENVFSKMGFECVHNNFPCEYRKDEKCIIKNDDVVRILDQLVEKNVFTKVRGMYKYNF